jgi:hypothetical protein
VTEPAMRNKHIVISAFIVVFGRIKLLKINGTGMLVSDYRKIKMTFVKQNTCKSIYGLFKKNIDKATLIYSIVLILFPDLVSE